MLPPLESLCRDFGMGLQDIVTGVLPGMVTEPINYRKIVDPNRWMSVEGSLTREELSVEIRNPPNPETVESLLDAALHHFSDEHFAAQSHTFSFFSHSNIDGVTGSEFLAKYVTAPAALVQEKLGLGFAAYGTYQDWSVAVTLDRSMTVHEGLFLNVAMRTTETDHSVLDLIGRAHAYFFDVVLAAFEIQPQLP